MQGKTERQESQLKPQELLIGRIKDVAGFAALEIEGQKLCKTIKNQGISSEIARPLSLFFLYLSHYLKGPSVDIPEIRKSSGQVDNQSPDIFKHKIQQVFDIAISHSTPKKPNDRVKLEHSVFLVLDALKKEDISPTLATPFVDFLDKTLPHFHKLPDGLSEGKKLGELSFMSGQREADTYGRSSLTEITGPLDTQHSAINNF